MSAIVARRLGIPVYHMEAGNRCYDDRVPEEVNRRVIDHCSSVLMPYTERSRANLLREGIAGDRIYVIGNPIKQVIDANEAGITASTRAGRHSACGHASTFSSLCTAPRTSTSSRACGRSSRRCASCTPRTDIR